MKMLSRICNGTVILLACIAGGFTIYAWEAHPLPLLIWLLVVILSRVEILFMNEMS